MTVVEARGVWFRYPHSGWVLRGASMEARGGEAVAVVGPTGAGKTTLLLLLAGLLKPERGTVALDGRPVGPWARRRIGLLLQDPEDMLFNPTVLDEIGYSLRSMGLPEAEWRRRAVEAARRLGVEELLDRPPHRLSAGQRKLVALASLIVYSPDVLLLDEPLANLDRGSAERLKRIAREHVKRGGVLILVTHSVDTVMELSTKTCILEDGVVECVSTCEAVAEGVLGRTSLQLPFSLQVLLERIGGWRMLARQLPGCS